MRLPMLLAAVAAFVLNPLAARADCSCLCLDGAYRPVCTSAEEVAQNRGLCHALAEQTCPVAAGTDALASFAPPAEGVKNCREAAVFDAGAGEFLTTRVCDVDLAE